MGGYYLETGELDLSILYTERLVMSHPNDLEVASDLANLYSMFVSLNVTQCKLLSINSFISLR